MIGGWVGVGILGAIILIVVLTLIIRGRNVKGLPNTVRGEITKVSGLADDVDPYVVVSSMNEMAHRTDFRIRPGESATFDETFTWSVSPADLEKFRTAGKVRFEVFNLKGAAYSAADPSLGAVEIPVSELYTEGQIEKIEALRLRTKKAIVINVKIGIFAEHFFFQSMNRFAQYWRMRQREISFWARFFSIPLSVYCIFTGLKYFERTNEKSMGITAIATGSVIAFTMLPHVLYWVGIRWLDAIKLDSLLSTFSLYTSCVSAMITVWRLFGPSDPIEVLDYFVTMLVMGVLALLFLAGDLKGEPGASCLGRTLGSLFKTLCCCFGSSRATILRAAL